MKKEYIERSGLLATLALSDYPWSNFEDAYEIVQNAPVEDVAPVVHGEWIEYQIPNIICCSICDCGLGVDKKHFKYCPNCGAKMDGGKQNDM